MITGDHPTTAYAIARDLDFPEGEVLTSKDLEKISDEELANIVGDVTVFARINPLDKLRIVNALQKRNEVVAMTGDGVNDAPALKKADIGVSMGLTGTEVVKEASDMVLLDDNFATLVSAVFQGRTIFENIRKFIVYLLSCNIAEVLVMFIALILGYPPPLLPLHLLWLNLVTDSFPALALGMEKGEEDLMKRPPRGKKEPILTKYHYGIILTQSIAITIATLLGFILSLKRTSNLNEARTIAYMVLVLAELLRAYSGRSFEGYLFRIGIFTNKFMNFSFIFGIILLIATIYIPQLRFIFKNTVPTIMESMDILLLAFLPFVISEFSKVIRVDEYGN
jgi:Ca2+-transporting ATPase